MTNFIERMRVAIKALRGMQIKTPFTFPNWRQVTPEWAVTNTQAFINEGFGLNAVIYSAIMYKARAVSSAPLLAYRRDGVPLGENNPLQQKLNAPNRFMSQVEFIQQAVVYLNVTGNNYTYIDRKDGGLYNLRPDRVYIVPDAKGIKGFMYVPEGKSIYDAFPILPEDMIHVRMPNPADPLEGLGYGMSPIEAVGTITDVDNTITNFLKVFMQKGTMLGGVLRFDSPLDDSDVATARRRWESIYGGSENWGSIAVLDSGGSFQRIGMTFSEMEFQALDARNEARILAALGVPGMLVGLMMDRSTFSNFEQADRVFWQNTFIPELRLFEVEFNNHLSERGWRIGFDLSRVPALQEDLNQKIDGAYKLWSMGTPRDVAFGVVGLKIEETAGGNVSFVPSGMVPVGVEVAPSPADEGKHDSSSPLDKREKALSQSKKEQLAAGALRVGDGYLEAYQLAARRSFERDKREVLRILYDGKAKSLQIKATVDWLSISSQITSYLMEASPNGWRETFLPHVTGLVTDNGNYWGAELGKQFNVENMLASGWFVDYQLKFADPISQTSARQISDLLLEANQKGLSIDETARGLERLFNGWMGGTVDPEDWDFANVRLPSDRTELIARTEITRAMGGSTQELFNQWGVESREWLSTLDSRCRPTHVSANGQVQPMGEAFSVGNSLMMHPGDSSLGAPLSEIANCRCTLIPIGSN